MLMLLKLILNIYNIIRFIFIYDKSYRSQSCVKEDARYHFENFIVFIHEVRVIGNDV